jgi:hypothetical protein
MSIARPSVHGPRAIRAIAEIVAGDALKKT